MIKFSKERVLLLHKLIAEETGGSIGVRDEALLESALEGTFAGFGDKEFYPTKEEKAHVWAIPCFPTMHLWMRINVSACASC